MQADPLLKREQAPRRSRLCVVVVLTDSVRDSRDTLLERRNCLLLQNITCNVLLSQTMWMLIPGKFNPLQGLELGQGLPSRRGALGAGRPKPPRGAAWRARRAAPFEFLRRAHFECGPSQRHHDGGQYQ